VNHVPLPNNAAAQVAAVTDGAVHAGPLVGIPQLLRDLGRDPASVFAADWLLRPLPGADPAFGKSAMSAIAQLPTSCYATPSCRSPRSPFGSGTPTPQPSPALHPRLSPLERVYPGCMARCIPKDLSPAPSPWRKLNLS